jgi:hypothetical protein
MKKMQQSLFHYRFTTIPFSSNLGQSFFKAIRLTPTASELLINRYERFCIAKPILLRSDPLTGEHTQPPIPSATTSNRFRPVVFKRKDEWAHSYSFNKADRRERMETIATGKLLELIFHVFGINN